MYLTTTSLRRSCLFMMMEPKWVANGLACISKSWRWPPRAGNRHEGSTHPCIRPKGSRDKRGRRLRPRGCTLERVGAKRVDYWTVGERLARADAALASHHPLDSRMCVYVERWLYVCVLVCLCASGRRIAQFPCIIGMSFGKAVSFLDSSFEFLQVSFRNGGLIACFLSLVWFFVWIIWFFMFFLTCRLWKKIGLVARWLYML